MAVVTQPAHQPSNVQILRQHGSRSAVAAVLSFAAIFSALLLMLGAGLALYSINAYESRVYPNVSVAGVDLGGLSQDRAEAVLDERFATFADQHIAFTYDGQSFETTPAELGVAFDAKTTAAEAFGIGRTNSLWTKTRNLLESMTTGTVVQPALTTDQAAFEAFMRSAAQSIIVPTIDASFISGTNDSIVIDPGQEGIAVDAGATYARFVDNVAGLNAAAIPIVTRVLPQAATAEQLRGVLSDAEALAASPFTFTAGDTNLIIPPAEMLRVVSLKQSGSPGIEIDETRFAAFVAALEPKVFQPGVNASIQNVNGEFIMTPAVDGRRLDIEKSTVDAMAALKAGERTVALTTIPVAPNITNQDVASASLEAQRMVADPVTLTWDGGSYDLGRDALAHAIVFDINPDRNPFIRLDLFSDLLGDALVPVASAVNVPGIDADFRWINNQVTVVRPESKGRAMDLVATTQAISKAIVDGTRTAAVVTTDVNPTLHADMAGTIQITDKLAESWTEYGSSVSNRRHNVELSTERANGQLIPPGGVYSFNDSIGPVTYDNGYRTGYGIEGTSDGQIQTIPSVGGGVCQVVTTLFHSVFRSGMPIEVRSWHLYWIPRYGQPPSGMRGLDATVDDQYGLDFLFRNGTDQWLAVKSWTDGSLVHFELWGTNPGWDVQIDDPVISNIRPARQEMVYQDSDQLPRGQTAFVESAQDGFDASIHRVVKKGDEVLEDRSWVSSYQAAQNVTLVGTGD